MATVTSITAVKAQEIEDASVVSGAIDPGNGHLILTTSGGTDIDAGVARPDAAIAAAVLTETNNRISDVNSEESARIAADAAHVTALHTDSGWTSLSFASGWTGTLFWRKIGNRLFLRGSGSRASGSNATVATLPAGSRPLQTYSGVMREGSGVVTVAIGTDGVITCGGGYTNGNTIYFDQLSLLTD